MLLVDFSTEDVRSALIVNFDSLNLTGLLLGWVQQVFHLTRFALLGKQGTIFPSRQTQTAILEPCACGRTCNYGLFSKSELGAACL